MWADTRRVDRRAAPFLLVAYPWIERRDYERARRLMIDGDLWPASYEVWQREAERAIRALAEEGVEPVRATLDIDAFANWCHSNDCVADCVARLTFAELIAEDELL